MHVTCFRISLGISKATHRRSRRAKLGKGLQRCRKLSGWNRYVQKNKGTTDMGLLSAHWERMSADEKERWAAAPLAEDEDFVAPGVEFEEYPICRNCVPPAASLTKSHADDWRCIMGNYCCPDPSDVIIEPKSNTLCGDEVRFDMCLEDMSQKDLQAHGELNDMLKRSCFDAGLSESFGSVHKGIPRMSLYFITFEVDLDIDSAQGAFLWQLHTQVNPMTVVFLANRIEHSEEVKEGKSFVIQPSMESLVDDVDVATMLFHRKHIRVHRVDYKLISLLYFTIRGFEDVTDYLKKLRRQRRKAVQDPVVSLVTGMLKRPRRTAGARRKTKLRQKSLEKSGDDPVEEDDGGSTDDSDEDDGGQEGNVVVDDPVVDDPVDLVKDEWERAHDEMLPSLYYDWDTFAYKLNDKDGPIQGSVKAMNKTKSMSVYCRQHGCSMLIAHKRAPSHSRFCRWFSQGLELPQGKAGRQRHLQMLKEFIAEEAAESIA